MIKKQLATFLLFLILISLEAVAQTNTPRTVQINGKCGGYYEYLPQGYSSTGTQTYPLLVFLHGIGECGNGSTGDLAKVLRNGPPLLISQNKFPTSFTSNGQSFKFIVISPQFTAWPSSGDVDAVIEYVKRNYKVDTKRIYVTGLSMGGGANWVYAADANYSSKVAAIAPFCGAAGSSTTQAKNLADNHVGIWAFHNSNDGSVSVQNTYNWVNYTNSFNPSPRAKMTIFNASGHNCWTTGYDPNYRENGMNVYEYLLQFSKGGTSVTPTNKAPTVSAGADKTITLPLSLLQLSGSASDPDGTITSYQWSKVSGPSTFSISSYTSASITLSALVQGTYVFRLTVKDNAGATAYDDVTINVNPLLSANKAPTVNVGADQSITLPTNSIKMNASASDADGSVQKMNWSKVSGPQSFAVSSWSSASTTISNLVEGTYIFRLTATDNSGATGYDDMTVTVKPASTTATLSVNAGTDQSISLPTNSVKLAANVSASGSAVQKVQWSKVSGPTPFTFSSWVDVNTTLSGLSEGKYVFRITATNYAGTSASDDITINVAASSSAPPAQQGVVVNAGTDQTVSLPNNSVKLSATASSSGSLIQKAQWSKVSGPTPFTFSSWVDYNTTLSGLAEGTYVFRLTVKTYAGDSGYDDITINVVNGSSSYQPATGSSNRVLIDLGTISTGKDQWGKYWNNVNNATEGNRLTNAVNISNQKTTIGLVVNKRLDGTFANYDNGINANNSIGNVGDYPASAVNDNAYTDWTETNGQWTITGLDPAKTYKIKFWGTRSTGSPRFVQIKPSYSSSWAEYNAANNRDANNGAEFSNITGLSSITFNIRSKANNQWGNISLIDITEEGSASSSSRSMISPELALAGTSSSTLSVYPNPATTSVVLTVSNDVTGPMTVTILNAAGTAVKSLSLTKAAAGSQQVYLTVSDLTPGTYIVNVKCGAWSSSTQLVKQ